MILKIVKYPEPVLQQPGEPVRNSMTNCTSWLPTCSRPCTAAQGIGLAAPQVAVCQARYRHRSQHGQGSRAEAGAGQSRDHLPVGQAIRRGRLPELSRDPREGAARLQGDASARRMRTASGSRWTARNCFRAHFSTRSTTWTAMLFIFRMSGLKRDLNLRKIRKMQREGTW